MGWREQVEHTISLPVANRAKNNGFGLKAALRHDSSLRPRPALEAARTLVRLAEGAGPEYERTFRRFTFLMPAITMYTTIWCGYCHAAKGLLDREGFGYREVSVDDDPNFRGRMYELTGRHTVPQIFVDDESIGGYQELARLIADGGLTTAGVASAGA